MHSLFKKADIFLITRLDHPYSDWARFACFTIKPIKSLLNFHRSTFATLFGLRHYRFTKLTNLFIVKCSKPVIFIFPFIERYWWFNLKLFKRVNFVIKNAQFDKLDIHIFCLNSHLFR